MNQSPYADMLQDAFEDADQLLAAGLGTPAAALQQTAIACALLTCTPMRMGNLVCLDVTRHLVRDQSGQLAWIFVPASEIKNFVPVEVPIPAQLALRIEIHLAKFRPVLLRDKPYTALFLQSSGEPIQLSDLRAVLHHFVLVRSPHRRSDGSDQT